MSHALLSLDFEMWQSAQFFVVPTPLVVLLFTTYLFLLTPVLNTLIRTQEIEADVFGLNAARQPAEILNLSNSRGLEIMADSP